MLALTQSEKYRKDLEKFKLAVSQIEVEEYRQRAEKLLQEYQRCCVQINESHNPTANNKVDPRAVRDTVENLYAVRKQLEQIVKDLKR